MEYFSKIHQQFMINYSADRINPNPIYKSWCIKEDYTLLTLISEGKSFTRASMIMGRKRKEIEGRFRKLFGTTNWVQVVTKEPYEFQIILEFLKMHYLCENEPTEWDENTMQETVEFLSYYGFK
jgi:hypothetical protein